MLSEDYVNAINLHNHEDIFTLSHFVGFSIEILNCFGDKT
jgi:hypothetical protein